MTHEPAHLSHPKYRPDIDGLRALAILSVVGFHAFPGSMAGGFIGVDIFFVISGYLISSIIFANLERDSFSLIEFYSRRIKRIFPALLLVMIASFVCGWFVLFADEYKQLGKNIVGGAGFISNFILWGESGYFDSVAETKPLLHLWSLSIEEQFYFFWPLLLAFGWRRKRSFVFITLAVAGVSFALNIYLIKASHEAAFYLPFPRFWELMIGGLLAYIMLHKPELVRLHKNWQSACGIILLLLGLLFIDRNSAFPGWWVLLPTLGTFFLISAGPQAWINKLILSNKLAVWIGLISYPLYLWHWPLLSFARIVEAGTPSPALRFGMVLLAVVCAWLTYSLIEKPIRFGMRGETKTLAMVVLMIATGGMGYLAYKNNGFEGVRQPGKEQYIRYFENSLPGWQYFMATDIPGKFRMQCDFYDLDQYRKGHSTRIPRLVVDNSCFERNSAYSKSVFIWGDSHAQMLNWGLKNNLPKNWQILQIASSGCAPNADVTQPSTTDYCSQSNWFALKSIKDTAPDVVVVAQNSGQTIKNFESVLKQLEGLGVKKVIFTGPTPHWTTDLPKIIARNLWENTPRRTYSGIDRQVLKNNLLLQQNFHSSEEHIFVNIIGFFCNMEGCLTYIGDDKKSGITTWDYGHLTPAASSLLAVSLLVPAITGANPQALP